MRSKVATLMTLNRKQQAYAKSFQALGNALASWLNWQDDQNQIAGLIKFLAASERFSGSDHRYMRCEIPLKLHAVLLSRIEGRKLGPPTLEIVPDDEESRALLALRDLINAGKAARLRFCLNCKQFWYCAGRIDQGTCSVRCKVALWQRTPRGRERKRKYMQRYRATLRGMRESLGRRHKLTMKRGRNLHVSLKKGE